MGLQPIGRRVGICIRVSIAGGDSFLGLPEECRQYRVGIEGVSIAGGDSFLGLRKYAFVEFARHIVSIAGGDSFLGLLGFLETLRIMS